MKLRYLILTLLCFNFLNVNSQIADFTISTQNNTFCSPQTVKLTQASTGNPTGFIWDFGDGQAGGAPVENHLYDYPGTYTITFTAVYANAASTITKSVTINPTPVVTISASRTNLCQPGIVSFTTSATGTVNSYEWNFGDGSPVQTTSANTVSHNFAVYGSFNITSKAISPQGCSAVANLSVSVSRFPISVSVSPAKGCLPANAGFSATATFPPGDGLQSILWNFGDGSPNVTGSTFSQSHIYNTTNNISTANVFITSTQGCTNQFQLDSFAFGIPPTNTDAYTTALRDTFCGSETIQFYGFADSANSYTWDFGDGSTEITKNTLITHKYSSLGNHTVTVTPYYNGCVGPVRSLNIVITGVIAAYTYANTCSDKKTYSFTNNSLGNLSYYQWVFSDAPSVIQTTTYNPVYTFPSVATTTASLLVIDNITGCRDSMTTTIYTANPVFVSSKTKVCKDSIINYTIQNPYPAAAGMGYELHINGNTIYLGGSTSYDYHPAFHGTFAEYVVISDTLAGTCNDSIYLSSQTIVSGPVASFTLPDLQCIDTSVAFVNNTYPFFPQDNIVSWKWDFGDGQKDSVQNPVPHKYSVPGQQIIQLLVTDINGCSQRTQGAVRVATLPSITAFPSMDTLCLGQTSMLTAYSVDSIVWSPAVNLSCLSCDTTYANPIVTTKYKATAISVNGCKNYDSAIVKVYGPINLTINPATSSVCPGTPLQLNLNSGGNIIWSPASFLSSVSSQNPVSTPDSTITYTVIVKDSVGCYADTASATITVFPTPSVDAGGNASYAYNSTFSLSPLYSPNISSYLWTGGNLSCTNCPSPTGTALQRQLYKIEVTDFNNCKASDSITIFVTCEKSNLLLPNAFTPNGDRLNDNFYPIAYGYRSIKSFTIFNRNGFKVFERKNFQPNISAMGWDGRIKNEAGANTQAFVWVIEAECDSGATIVTKGTVMLIR